MGREKRNAMPKVSVVIPVYNSDKYIEETLDSVLSQTYTDFEVIVVDDGSEDKTPSIVKQYQVKYPEKVKLIQKENGGPASARNMGIKVARGEFIAFNDSDDLWLPSKLEKQLEYFNSDPQVGLVYSKYTSFKGDKELRTKPEGGHSGWIFTKLLSKSIIQASTMIVKRECLDAVGTFDESFSLADEYDMSLRIAKKFQCYFVDKALTRYRVHDTNASKNNLLFDKENLKIYKKIYNNDTDLCENEKELLKKRISRYCILVAKGLYNQGQLDESKKYQKEALEYLSF
jgi:glycosyltransferase involved in cell wall biosynthesis